MELKNLFSDERAVSPVIGVILMVAITVILAAVIGTFVLGLGDSLSETSPQATYDWSQSSATNGSNVTVDHTGGDSIDASAIGVTINAEGNTTSFDGDISDWASGDTVQAGDSFKFHEGNITTDATSPGLYSGDQIRITWSSEEGGSSSVLTEYTIN